MAGESQQIPESMPDPSVFTTEAIARAQRAERDWMLAQLAIRDERLRGIDRATDAFQEAITRVPTDVQKEVGHLREVMAQAFQGVDQRFMERDTRSERESKDNKVAVDAAFSAQKEAASEQNKSNTLAITKSEQQTTEAIAKLEQLFKTDISAQAQQLGDLKERIGRAEERVGRSESLKQGGREAYAAVYAFVGFVAVVLSIITTYALSRP